MLIGVSDASNTLPNCVGTLDHWLLAGKNNVVTVHGILGVSAVNNTYYLRVQPNESSRNFAYGAAHLLLIFLPMEYGTVDQD